MGNTHYSIVDNYLDGISGNYIFFKPPNTDNEFINCDYEKFIRIKMHCKKAIKSVQNSILCEYDCCCREFIVLARLYELSKDYKNIPKAIFYYKNVISKEHTTFKTAKCSRMYNVPYMLAELYKKNKQYDDAIKYYKLTIDYENGGKQHDQFFRVISAYELIKIYINEKDYENIRKYCETFCEIFTKNDLLFKKHYDSGFFAWALTVGDELYEKDRKSVV